MEDILMNEFQIFDEVMFDWFPNASTDKELEEELDCISWDD